MRNKYLRKIKKLWWIPYLYILDKISHEKYAKKIGVNYGENCHFYGKIYWGTEPWIIKMGNNVHITNECRFVTHDGGVLLYRHLEPTLELTKPIILGSNVYIGTRAIIMGGVKIGNNVIIGAGSIVTHDIPDNSVAVGVPARVIKSADDYFKKAKKESIGLGNLLYDEKDRALKKYYNYSK